jgi:hypothetical protein
MNIRVRVLLVGQLTARALRFALNSGMRYRELMIETTIPGVPPSGKFIAYHGTGAKITQFFQPSLAGHFFTQDKDYAKGYAGGKTPLSKIDKPKKTRNYLLTVELEINHMFDTKHDPQALAYYNTRFVPQINEIRAKYHQPLVPILDPGRFVSFVNADDLYRHFMRFKPDYDGMLVDEGSFTSPAIVPFNVAQIKIVKTEIVKFD